jgi:uncharacterized protein YecA (UPF0149 family)
MPITDLSAIMDMARPPKAGDADGQKVWQWAVFAKLWLLLAFSAWSVGAFTIFGSSGFARAGDVAALQADVRAAAIAQSEAQLFDIRLRQCHESGGLRIALQQQLIKLMQEYARLSGQIYPLPDCKDLE